MRRSKVYPDRPAGMIRYTDKEKNNVCENRIPLYRWSCFLFSLARRVRHASLHATTCFAVPVVGHISAVSVHPAFQSAVRAVSHAAVTALAVDQAAHGHLDATVTC